MRLSAALAVFLSALALWAPGYGEARPVMLGRTPAAAAYPGLPAPPSSALRLQLRKQIFGSISPKSVVSSQTGLFFAQNMMYRHTITVYDRRFHLVKTIPDTVRLSAFGYERYKGSYRGAPVEAAFSPDGAHAYVSNYWMEGSGFSNPGDDVCSPAAGHDESFLYRIDTNRLEVDDVIAVGSVPKYVAVSPDGRYVLVSNWCSYDLSVVSTAAGSEVKRLPLGPYPRGIAIGSESKRAFVAVMGSADVAVVDLRRLRVGWIRNVGAGPRHLSLDPAGRYLYVTLNAEGRVAKVDLRTRRVVAKVATGSAPRSMAIAADGQSLYVVNYESDTVSKIRTRDMTVLQTAATNPDPIGIAYDAATRQVWVACYSGSIMVFRDA